MPDLTDLSEVELSKIADKLLNSSFAKHLIREEADQQIKAWIKWRIVPISIVLSAGAVFFGWKGISLSKAVEHLESKIAEMQQGTDGLNAKISVAKDLVEVAKQAVENSKVAAKTGNDTALESLRIVKDTGDEVGLVNALVVNSGRDLEGIKRGTSEQKSELSAVSNEAKALGERLSRQSARIETLDKEREDLDRKFQAARDELMPDIRRFRVYHVQVLTTGRERNNIVQFGDPDGKGKQYNMSLNYLKETSSGSGYFSADLTLNGPDSGQPCIRSQEVKLGILEPYDLGKLKEFQETPSCIPAGVKLFIDATPYVSTMRGGKDSQPAAQFVFLRVDTEAIAGPI